VTFSNRRPSCDSPSRDRVRAGPRQPDRRAHRLQRRARPPGRDSVRRLRGGGRGAAGDCARLGEPRCSGAVWRFRDSLRMTCRRQREANDQGTSSCQERAARNGSKRGGHQIALPVVATAARISSAVRRTALRMRIWVPQRHRWGSSVPRMLLSEGFGFRCSSA